MGDLSSASKAINSAAKAVAAVALYIPPGSRVIKSKSAFDWDIYKNRKSALQHLRKQSTLVDIILETEDGSSRELVHSQVISAFSDKLTEFIQKNCVEIDVDATNYVATSTASTNNTQSTTTTTLNATSNVQQQLLTSKNATDIILPNLYVKKPLKLKLIRLPKVNKYILNVLIECAYTGYVRTDLPSGGIWQVLHVADYYHMSEVIRACCNFLDKNLNRFNCIHFYHVGTQHKHTLQRNAWHQIRANFKYILNENLLRSSRDLLENGLLGPNLTNIIPLPPNNNQVQQQQTNNNNEDNNKLNDNNLATIKYEHFEALLLNDKLNIDHEESVWYAIKLWCNYNLNDRSKYLANLLTCMRFPRFRNNSTSSSSLANNNDSFSLRSIWRDPLIINNKEAQHQLALLDRNARELLTGSNNNNNNNSRNNMYTLIPLLPQYHRDGYNLPCSIEPKQLRPRVPHSLLLAIGGWQQGQPTKLIESYDLNCNMWFVCKHKILTQLAYHGIENINNLLYICGGTDGDGILNELFVFNPVHGECQQKASMREPRCYVSTANLNNCYLYAMGGHNGVQRMRSVEKFDLKNELWSRCPDMNVARSDASACVYQSMIFIAGGLNDQVIESSVEFFNHLDQSWTFIQSMLTPRTSFTLLNYQSFLLAIGGNNGHERLNSVELYDFKLKQWQQHSQMRHRRSTFSAALLDESKLIVVGGYNGQTPFSQVEMYDLDSNRGTWQMLQKIRYDRSGLKVVVVNDLPNAIEYSFLGSSQAALLAATSGSGGGKQLSTFIAPSRVSSVRQNQLVGEIDAAEDEEDNLNRQRQPRQPQQRANENNNDDTSVP